MFYSESTDSAQQNLKTLFNIVEDRFLTIVNFKVCVV